MRKVHSIKENGADVSAGSIEKYCVRVASEEPSAAADQSILTLVLDKSLSMSLLDSDSWKTAVKCIQRAGPTYNPPSSSTVNGKLLPEAVIDMKALLCKELQETMISGSITGDGYTGLAGKHYFVVTLHTVQRKEGEAAPKLVRAHYVLGCECFDESHRAPETLSKIQGIIFFLMKN